MRYMRPSKYGGYSECRSPDDKVGFGRCHHILEKGQRAEVVKYSKEDRIHYTNIEGGALDSKTPDEKRKIIKDFTSDMKKNKGKSKNLKHARKLK